MSRRVIKKTFKQSVEYSIALFFVVMFFVSSLYALPNTQVIRSQGDGKNSTASNSKLDGSYKRYCVSDDGDGTCVYVAINDDALLNIPFSETLYRELESQQTPFFRKVENQIRAPPHAFI